ncbi:MAG: peptidylprolyl isomerase [Cyclobacteriaceae bacterium]|nr:peptidylprolyl isomerase [Cyclobacteriaceae bacterium]
MKMQSNRRILRFLIVSVLLLAGVRLSLAQESKGFVVDKIIAKVDNYILLNSEFDGAYQNYLSNGGRPSEQARCGIFSQLVINKLLVAKAEIDSVVVTDLEVDNNTDQRMNMILQNSGNSPEQLERTYGKTLEQIKLELRDQIREQMLGNAMQRKITKGLSVTPAEVKRFFSKIPTDSLPFYSADVVVAQIVRKAQISDEQKLATKLKLTEIRQRILDGEDFNELARKFSEDPSAQYNGGDMGYVGRGAMVAQYEAMAFKLKKGEISQPFESMFGFHIMQLIDRRGNEYHSRHILISAVPSREDLNRAEQYLDSLRLAIQRDSITFEDAAKKYSDDLRTKGFGGYFTDEDGGSKISVKDMDPIVYFNIDTMKVGSIGRPTIYRTDDGKDAVRILYFKDRQPPHQANLKDDWHRIQAAALAEKRDKMLAKWFEKAKNDVFIKLDPAFDSCGILQ